MIDRTEVLVVVAAATFIVPLVFVVLAGVTWLRRSRGLPTGRLGELLALVGGASLGTMGIPVWNDWLVAAPLYVVAVAVLVERWRRGRRVQAGLFLAGLALPSATLWGYSVALLMTGQMAFEAPAAWAGFLGAAAIVGLGTVVVLRGDPAPAPPDPAAPAGRPGSRRIGTIAAAILEPARIGPFRIPDLAALVAIVVSLTLVAFVPVPNRLLGLTIAILVASVVATEAYVRSFPTRSRKSFEAFSWLGEHELELVRRATGEGVPTSKRAAERWLARHPETPETAWIRSEVLVLAGRSDEALAVAARMPEVTPEQRFWRASHLDLAEWARGGPGDPTAMEAHLDGLGPEGSDERLRGEVAIAASRVRQAMDAGLPPDDAPDLLEPLVRVREKLGRRADGQVGRALRKRMIPAFLALGLLFGLAMELLALPLPFGRP